MLTTSLRLLQPGVYNREAFSYRLQGAFYYA